MKLAEQAEALAHDTAFWLLGFEEESAFEPAQQGPISVELGDKLRALAIIALVSTGDTDKFLHNLVRSGRVRETYLARMRRAGVQDEHHLVASRSEGLLDAIASGDMDLAHRIAWLSPRTLRAHREYEDDFCHAQILHRLVHGVQAASVYEPLLARFEAALRGQASARLAVCKALIDRSQNDFDDAFNALLQERHAQIQADIARCRLEDPMVIAGRRVFIEGLALLRLAGHAGLRTLPEYLYCPAIARLPMRHPLPHYAAA